MAHLVRHADEVEGQHGVFLSPAARWKMIAGDEGLTWVGIGSQPAATKPRQ
jgi:hypothetical protein